MKFGKYLEEKARPEWRNHYLDYKALKDLIKESATEDAAVGVTNYSPRTTSLSVQRAADRRDSAEERFFRRLEAEVDKVGRFTAQLVEDLRGRLRAVQEATHSADSQARKDSLLEEAKSIGDEFLQLEKYVNLNYMGFHKILKKHDKMLPHSPCRQFYISHLHNQPWVQGNYSDLLVVLSDVYSQLRGDARPKTQQEEEEEAAMLGSTGVVRSSAKYWVRMSDVSTVKHHILQHLPVFQHDKSEGGGDAQLVNSVYFDNSSLELYHGRLDKRPGAIALRMRWYGPGEPQAVQLERKTHRESWKGEESVKERLTLPEQKVVPFLEGEFTTAAFRADLEAEEPPPSEAKEERDAALFEEVQKTVDSKQLKPMVRTQYMRTAFQIPFDGTVRVSLDTNIAMIKENPEEGPSCTIAGRWYRDPSLPIHRTEITRFPHAVLEIKLSLSEGELTPEWVQELLDSGLLTEVHKFSKFLHGTATLFPDMVQAVPYWVDDESVRASMLISAPEQPADVAPTALDKSASRKPRKRYSSTVGDEAEEPLLGGDDEEGSPHLDLMGRTKEQLQGLSRWMKRHADYYTISGGQRGGPTFFDWWFSKPAVKPRPRPAGPVQDHGEPKTYLANERTFLAWLHMAVTLGSVAAAMLGFTNTTSTGEKVVGDLTAVIAMILLPVAILVCGYALAMFVMRAREITHHTQKLIEERRGPLVVSVTIVGALSAVFIISFVDLYKEIQAGAHGHPPGPGPHPLRGLARLLGL